MERKKLLIIISLILMHFVAFVIIEFMVVQQMNKYSQLDVNRDGKVDLTDLVLVRNKILEEEK